MAELLATGVLSVEEGKVTSGQLGQIGGRRASADVLTPVEYPHRGQLLQDERQTLARGKRTLPRLTEALEGMFTNIQKVIPYQIGPEGMQASQFIIPRLDPDMPYALSRLVPVIPGSKEETDRIYQSAKKAISSSKYPATRREVTAALADITPYLPRMQQVVHLGLAGGPGYNAINVNQAMRSALLLMSASTIPESAAMSTYSHTWMRRNNLSGVAARQNEVHRRLVEDVISGAKGAKGQYMGLGGPRLSEAVRMYTQMIAPLAGLRSGRDIKTRQAFTPNLPPELLGFGRESGLFPAVEKNVKALQSFEASSAVSGEVVQLSPTEKLARIEAEIRKAVDPIDYKAIEDIASRGNPKRFRELPPFERAKRLLAALNDPDLKTNSGRSYQGFAQKVVESVAERPATVKTAPSVQRQTAAAAEAGALGGVLSRKEATKVAKKTAKKMGVRLNRNTLGMLMLLGGILSTGFLAAGSAEEAA